MPAALRDVSCAALNGKLYIGGGNDGGDLRQAFQARLLEFDPSSGEVVMLAALRRARAEAQMVALPNGNLMITGGEFHH